MEKIESPKPDDKFFQVIYHSEGQVDVASNNMTVFDLWGLSNYIKMRADELYITTQSAQRVKDAAAASQKSQQKDLVIAQGIPEHLKRGN